MIDHSSHPLPVFTATEFRVTFGANEGDALSFADDLVLDDCYELRRDARADLLTLRAHGAGRLSTLRGTGPTAHRHDVHLDSLLRFMCPHGRLHDVLVLVELARDASVAGIYLSPLTPLKDRTRYALMAIDRPRASQVFAQLGSASFATGTRITLPTGAQCPIETLRIGDSVLTRDDGPQPIRWIGRSTVRADGAMAPIHLAAGALHNNGPLMLSPGHRLFIYQRSDALRLGRAEVAVKASDLIGSQGVTRAAGGFVDQVQLVFDSHQIIFAEGIAAESTVVDDRAKPLVSAAIARKVVARHRSSQLPALEVGAMLGDGADVAALLRHSTTR